MKSRTLLFIFFLICSLPTSTFAGEKTDKEENYDNSVVIDRIGRDDIEVKIPSLIFTFKEANITLRFINPNHTKLLANKGRLNFIINGEERTLNFENGTCSFPISFANSNRLSIYAEDFSYSTHVTAYPLWALLVPLVLLVFMLLRNRTRK